MKNKKNTSFSKEDVTKLVPQPIPNNIENLPKLDADIIKELNAKISDAIKAEIINKQKENTKTENDYLILQKIVTEYLKSFIIIGYTFEGKQVTISCMKNQEEINAMFENVRQIFLKFMNRIEGD
jgi:hypothetical protein